MGDGNRKVIKLDHLIFEDRLVLDKLREKGKAWIVGGWVRDLLSGTYPTDIDIATNLKPNEVRDIFPRSIMVGEKFGTAIVRLNDTDNEHYQCEVTTLRADGGYTDGRRPENVVFGNRIEEDLERRDFTINAMAIEPRGVLVGQSDPVGELVDNHGGEANLDSGVLRTVGEAQNRLGEDGLRVIRAFRFLEQGKSSLRKMDSALSSAISSNRSMLRKVSKERIWHEIRTILSGQNSKEIVRIMDEHGVFDTVIPGISVNLEVKHSEDYLVNLALMCSSQGCEGFELAEELTGRLKLSKNERNILSSLHGYREIELDHSASSVRRFAAKLTSTQRRRALHYIIGLGVDTLQFEASFQKFGRLRAGSSPLVDGNLLSSLTGLDPGRKLGRLKDWLHRIQVEEDIGSSDGVISLLGDIGWKDSDYEYWPILSWP